MAVTEKQAKSWWERSRLSALSSGKSGLVKQVDSNYSRFRQVQLKDTKPQKEDSKLKKEESKK